MTERTPFRQRATARLVAGLGGTVAVGLSLGMAIMAAARPTPLAYVRPGEDVDTGRWRVNVAGARFAPGKADAANYMDRQDTLILELNFTNLSAISSNGYGKVVVLDPPIDGLEDPTYLLARDGSMVFDLHPDMPEYVLATWKWPPGKPVPEKLKLSLAGQLFKPRDNLYGVPNWFPQDPVAVVEVPVTESAGTSP